jgi:SAM-dependent methyltransferase
MRRIPEPELMNAEDQARAYAEADFSEPNTLFMDLLGSRLPGPRHWQRAVDLGCGPADITLRFARAYPGCSIEGIDGASAMLSFGHSALNQEPALAKRVRLLNACLPGLPLTDGAYDLILSNSLLHHLHDPATLWAEVRRLARPGAGVLVMDLMRPPHADGVESLVRTYAADAPGVLRRDFRNSLLAAFEPGEVEQQLELAGLSTLSVEQVSDRHLAVSGVLAD